MAIRHDHLGRSVRRHIRLSVGGHIHALCMIEYTLSSLHHNSCRLKMLQEQRTGEIYPLDTGLRSLLYTPHFCHSSYRGALRGEAQWLPEDRGLSSANGRLCQSLEIRSSAEKLSLFYTSKQVVYLGRGKRDAQRKDKTKKRKLLTLSTHG